MPPMSLALPIINSSSVPPHASDSAAPPPAPAHARDARRMIDSHGRTIRDLRLSVTDRCNFRCIYCMDPDFRYMPKRELLALDEYIRLARISTELGVEKLRITGGEPTLYPDLLPLIRQLASLNIRDLAMTTNGSRVTEEAAHQWKEAGLHRITLSIDSLRPDRLKRITRSDTTVESTIRAIRIAQEAGLGPIKVNAVIMRGINDDEIADFADFAIEHNIDMRLIEFMPLDSSRAWKREDVISADEMLEAITKKHTLIPIKGDRPDSTSLNFRIEASRIGIIAPVSRPFCGACSRLRITADGKVRPCLFSTREWDIRSLLRAGADDEQLAQFLIDSTWTKQKGHGIGEATFTQPQRTMSAIGG